uniref:Uncharacterized protein n=1 Tax=Solanum lycopersicum TaxID=4081 RepID=A0A3Q7J112_SOLLC
MAPTEVYIHRNTKAIVLKIQVLTEVQYLLSNIGYGNPSNSARQLPVVTSKVTAIMNQKPSKVGATVYTQIVMGRMLIGKKRAKFFRQLGYQLGAIINKQVMKCRGLSLPQYMPLLPLWHLCKFKLLKRVKWLFGGQRTIELFSHFCYSMHPSNGKEFQRRKLS